MKKFFKHLWLYLKPFLNWKFLICYLIPWMITNGVWYAGLVVGLKFNISWLSAVCGAYIAWLYMPWACEKILIIPVALWLCKIIFKNDEKTIKDLNTMYETAKADFHKIFKGGKKKCQKKK